MKIIDCFTFYNEFELLNYRLNILKDIVDYFVIVESTHTFVGREKPLYFRENKAQFDFVKDKIIHVVVDDFKYKITDVEFGQKEHWINENYQRICIDKGLSKIDLNDEDVITICDLDEIPDPVILTKVKSGEIIIGFQSLEMDFYYYNLNSKITNPTNYPKIIRYSVYKERGRNCQEIRFVWPCTIIPKGGWHLSYFGNVAMIKNKIENFAHQEFNKTAITDADNIITKIQKGNDLFDRSEIDMKLVAIEDNPYLPPHYNKYLQDYIRF